MASVSVPSIIKLSSKGNTRQVITVEGDKAYYEFETINYGLTPVTPTPPVTIAAQMNLVFHTLNVYELNFKVYPSGCPMVQLFIKMEVVNSPLPRNLHLETVEGVNSISVRGEIPPGTTLRFWTDPKLLRYFEQVEFDGQIKVTDTASKLAVISNRDATMPLRYITSRPGLLNLLPPELMPAPGENSFLPDQSPPGGVFAWTQAIIPWTTNQPIPSGPGVILDQPEPLVPPEINGYNDRYNKFRSVPDSDLFYLGVDALAANPTQEKWSLFIRNFADRGYAKKNPTDEEWQATNFAKRQYMDALSVDKIQFYMEKINAFVNTTFSEIVANRLPLASTFQRNMIRFFLSIHIGVDEYPAFVTDYFQGFLDYVGIGDGFDPRTDELLTFGNMTAPKVFEYFHTHATRSIAAKDRSTIAYWWDISGLSPEALLFECVHNNIAFSQFTNTIYSAIYVSINPTNTISEFLPPYPNFFTEYRNAPTSNAKLDVAREMFRLIVPNGVSFSRINDQLACLHIHQDLMVAASPGANVDEKAYNYFTYQPEQYAAAGFSSNLDGLRGLPINPDFLSQLPTSPLDRETVIDVARPLIPIFPKPVYTPFGLGYRRCAGEILVMFMAEKLLERFGEATYELRVGSYPTVYVGPFKGVPDNMFAVQTA